MHPCGHTFTTSAVSLKGGGCWYCGSEDYYLMDFSFEWDTLVHICCIEKACKDDPTDQEAQIFYKELGEAAV
jgi:hypothetical protein